MAKKDKQEPEQPSEVEKLKALAGAAGIDAGALVAEISASIEGRLAGKLDGIKDTILDNISGQIKGIKTELVSGVNTLVEAQFAAYKETMGQDIFNEFEKRLKAGSGGNSPSGGDNAGVGGLGSSVTLGQLLEHSDKIVNILNAWRQPSGDQQFASQIRLLTTGMSMGAKLKSGQLTPEDIAKSFETEKK